MSRATRTAVFVVTLLGALALGFGLILIVVFSLR